MESNGEMIDRRSALAAMGVAGVGALTACASGSATALGSATGLSAQDLGYDAGSRRYTLPPLPYAYDALAPAIDEQTMRIHHGKHHQGYVNGLNRALENLEGIRAGTVDAGLIKHWSRELTFHGSGHVNHTMFWASMKPGGGNRPTGDLAAMIERDFGSYDGFDLHFQAAARTVEGSGWGWLVYEPVADRLLVMQGEKQQDMLMTGVRPLLGIDVWEHAYYLNYQNRRGDYVRAFMGLVDWGEIGRRLASARA